MKRIALFIVSLALAIGLFSGCGQAAVLNGTALSEYTIVYSQTAPDYCQRAAQYIQQKVLERTGIELAVKEAESGTFAHEIVVGETNRAISGELDAQTQNVEFAILADGDHVAMEGDYFIIAAAAYYFVETYITGKSFRSKVPEEISIHTPITLETKNVILLIGDGMGTNHTKLIGWEGISREGMLSDGETMFYGEYLPYQGILRTDSLTGITDSAAAATALACGYKTVNSYVGRDENLQDVTSLTELAGSLGMATAVMSTEESTGATPAGFSAHADSRGDTNVILAGQKQLQERYGTIINCGLQDSVNNFENEIVNTLAKLEEAEKGFFLMYEEAYIDKASHNWQMEETYEMVLRFDQAIGLFMEHAFYYPDTLVLITADHETGGIMQEEDGSFTFNYEGHTGRNVPIYAYGYDAGVFDGYDEENNEVPQLIAELWGCDSFGW